MRKTSILVLALIAGILFQGCQFIKAPRLIKQGYVSDIDFFKELDFNFRNNLIFIDVVIKGKHYNFIFDTGAELSVVGQHIADEIDYTLVTTSKVNANSKSAYRFELIEIPEVNIGGISFEQTGAIIADISHFDQTFGCKSIDGIIGNNLMRKASWQIDYEHEILRLSDHVDRFQVSKQATSLEMNAGKMKNIYFDVTVDGVAEKFTFDTGYNGKLTADSAFFRALKAKNPDLEFTTETGIASKDLLGNNLGQTYNSLSQQIAIEGLILHDQIITLKGKGKSLIGNGIYEHFTLTIDWDADRVYFDPIKEILPDSLVGFEITLSPDFISRKITVSSLMDDFPLSEELDLEAIIIAIDGKDVSALSLDELCSYWETEQEKMKQLEHMNITVLDQGLKKDYTLTRRTWLPK